MTPRALILRAPGINRDEDAAAAVELAGGRPERIHVNRVVEGTTNIADYALLIIPGGFSYGDHLGAGKLLAVDLAHRLGEQLVAFVADGRPVIGICNGFQVLV
jgi:phosphoribosylformylglycinamidine synthase